MEFLIILIGIVILYPTIRILIDRRNHKIKRTFYPKAYNPDYDSPNTSYNTNGKIITTADWMKVTEVPGTGKVIID